MDWQPKVIVAAIDGSEQSVNAARQAAAIARTTGGRLIVVTVVRPPEGWWGLEGAPPTPEALSTAIASGRKQVLDRALAALDASDVALSTVEELGDPAAVIISVCEQEDADLLVIGRRGAGLVERLMLGSVADRLAHQCPCPLLIVP